MVYDAALNMSTVAILGVIRWLVVTKSPRLNFEIVCQRYDEFLNGFPVHVAKPFRFSKVMVLCICVARLTLSFPGDCI